MTGNSLRSDLHSLSIPTQQSTSANTSSSHPVPVVHSSAPVISTAGQHWSGHAAAANPPLAAGYSWMSQTLSEHQPAYDYATRCSVTGGLPQLYTQAASDVQHLSRLLTAQPREDSQLMAVTETGRDDDDEYDDNGDESSVLSLSVNRFVTYSLITFMFLKNHRDLLNACHLGM